MSVRATVNLLKKNPKMTRSQADKKLGYSLPDDFWEMAKKFALGGGKTRTNKAVSVPRGHPRRGVEDIMKKVGSNLSIRDKCMSILKENINATREDAEKILGELPKKDTFRRAQMLAGGVTTYQKTVIKEILYAGEKMAEKGLDPFSMNDKDVRDITGHNESCKFRGLIMQSDIFKKNFSKGTHKRNNPKPGKNPSKGNKKVLSKKSAGSKLIAKIMVPAGGDKNFDVKLVKQGDNHFLEIRNKG